MKSVVNKFLGSSFLLEPITLGGAALIAGGTALANWLFNKEQQSSNVGRSKELMDYQMSKQKNYQQWLSAMQFPNMIASLRSAGLNPNLALGGTPSQPIASSPNASSSQNSVNVDIMNALALASQIENTKADTRVKENEADKVVAETENIQEQTKYQKFINENAYTKFEAEIDQIRSVTELNKEQKDLVHQNIQNQQQELKNLIEVNENLKKQGKLTDEQIKQVEPMAKAQMAEIWANARYMTNEDKRAMQENVWRCELLAAEASQTGMSMQLQMEQKKLVSEQTRIIEKYGDAQAITGMVAQSINAVTSGISTFLSAKSAVKGTPVRTSTSRSYSANGSYTETYGYGNR